MKLVNFVEDKFSEKKSGQFALQLLNFFEKFRSISSEQFDEKKPIYRKIASSKDLRKDYRIRLLKEYYIKPKYLTLSNSNGDKIGEIGYVPVEFLCRKYLKNVSIRAKLDQEANYVRSTEKFSSCLDSEQFSRLKGKLKCQLFIDDAQISPTNGLGTGKGQKYVNVYLRFIDMPAEYLSSENDIELLMMVKRSQLDMIDKDIRMATLFHQFTKDMNRLMKNGIEIDGKRYNVAFCHLNGDNKGVYECLGFGEGFQNDAFVCRYCLATGRCRHVSPEVAAQTRLHNKNLRHNVPSSEPLVEVPKCDQAECHTIQDNQIYPLKRSENYISKSESTKNGVVRNFPFQSLFIHGIDPSNIASPDPLHDLCEGTLQCIVEIIFHQAKNIIQGIHRKLTVGQIETIFAKSIRNFPFFEGNPKLRWQKGEFKLEGKGIQVCFDQCTFN